jgi:ribosomal protein L37AE/L43A
MGMGLGVGAASGRGYGEYPRGQGRGLAPATRWHNNMFRINSEGLATGGFPRKYDGKDYDDLLNIYEDEIQEHICSKCERKTTKSQRGRICLDCNLIQGG